MDSKENVHIYYKTFALKFTEGHRGKDKVVLRPRASSIPKLVLAFFASVGTLFFCLSFLLQYIGTKFCFTVGM